MAFKTTLAGGRYEVLPGALALLGVSASALGGFLGRMPSSSRMRRP
jgi:hypothetical protein